MPGASEIVHTDVTNTTIVFAVLGFLFVVYGQLSFVIKEHLYLSEPLVAVTLGIIVGPSVLGWVEPRTWGDNEIFHETAYQFTRLVLGVQVLFTGIDLPKKYVKHEAKSLTVMLLGMMTIAWLVTAALIWGLIRLPAGSAPDGVGYSLTFLEALTISAAVTPTDPVLAASITKGRFAEKYVPVNVRNIILAESGANDGLGFPFLYLAIYLLNRASIDQGTSVGTEIGRWVYAVLIYQVLLSTVYGAVLGFLARKSLRYAESRKWIDRDNFHAYGLGLALFTLGTTGLFGSDDVLACWAAGNSFTWDDWYRERNEETNVQGAVDMLLNVAVFIYIGAIIEWDLYHISTALTAPVMGGIQTWRIVLLGLFVLLLRRPPWTIAASRFIPALTDWKETIFTGWFGPIGVGAVFYIQVAEREIPDDGSRDKLRALYSPVVLFCAFSSILAHGVTIPLSRLGPHAVRKVRTLQSSRTNTISAGQTLGTSTTLAKSANGQAGTQGKGTQNQDTTTNGFGSLIHRIKSINKPQHAAKKDSSDFELSTISSPFNPRRRSGDHDPEVRESGSNGNSQTESPNSDDRSGEVGPPTSRPPDDPLELPTHVQLTKPAPAVTQ
ncbi:unnamed protein product [Sympodiomycopsis kandeliae]